MSETKTRYSKQRQIIYDVLKNDMTHPNVDTIYTNVRQIIPDISLGTVYRNLNLLADQGKIIRLDVGDGTVHFDARVETHYHLVCDKCGSIKDLFLSETLLSNLIDKVQEEYDGCIYGADIIFHGTCQNCLTKKH